MLLSKTAALLASLGFSIDASDAKLGFIVGSVTERLLNETNQSELPEGLTHLAVEMAVGEYLRLLKNSGELEGFAAEAAIKQIQEGDTSVTFALGEGSATPEQRLDSLIAYLTGGRLREVIRYRRLLW